VNFYVEMQAMLPVSLNALGVIMRFLQKQVYNNIGPGMLVTFDKGG